jgi:glycosyltransferase involved in cell wall biosynthesis
VSLHPSARIHSWESPPKILLLTWEYPPAVVGKISEHIRSLAHGLVKEGLDVTVIYPSEEDRVFIDEQVKILTAGNPIKNYIHILNYVWALSISLTRRSADFLSNVDCKNYIIHAHEWTSCLPAVYLKWRYNLPIILTVYSTESIRGGKGTLLGDGIVEVERLCLKVSDIVLAGNDEVASRLRDEYGVIDKIMPADLGAGEVKAALNAYRRLRIRA